MTTDQINDLKAHPLNRHLYIVDNYHLLKSMDTASIDLICTDPPFAKNETFVGGLTPPLQDDERQREMDRLREWGIDGPSQAEQNNVIWPTDTTTAKPLPPRKYKTSASIFTREEMLMFLLGLSGWRAWCCGFANWKVSSYGRPIIEHTSRNFELDHIDPKSKRGRHEIDNRAPLCPYHNNTKGDRRIHLDELREEIIQAGELAVRSADELVDLAWAREQALEHWASERMWRQVGSG